MNYPTFTAKELESIENLDKGEVGKQFGLLKATQYVGKNKSLLALNDQKRFDGKKYIGSLRFNYRESIWYFDAIDNESYRIPEPQDGIDSLFDLEFKRVRAE